MNKENKFYITLKDTTGNEKTTYTVITHKEINEETLNEFKQCYDNARNEWYDGKTDDFLFNYIKDKVMEKGFFIHSFEASLELDF